MKLQLRFDDFKHKSSMLLIFTIHIQKEIKSILKKERQNLLKVLLALNLTFFRFICTHLLFPPSFI